MADFLTRLAERTLGVASVAQPIIPAMFTQGPAVAIPPSESGQFFVEEELPVASAPVTRQDFHQTAQHFQHPLPGMKRSYQVQNTQVTATSARPIAQLPQVLVEPQNQDVPKLVEHENARPPQMLMKESLVPGVDVHIDEQHHNTPTRQDAVSNEPHINIPLLRTPLSQRQESLTPEEHVMMSSDPISRNGELVQDIHEANPNIISHQAHSTNASDTEIPLASERLNHRKESMTVPINTPNENYEPHDKTSLVGGEIVQQAHSGERSRQGFVANSSHLPETQTNLKQLVASESVQQEATPPPKQDNSSLEHQHLVVPGVQQLQASASRKRTDHMPVNEHRPMLVGNQPHFAPSTAQNDLLPIDQRTAVPIAETHSVAPTIRVTIGRIDVRAVTPPASTPNPQQNRAGPTLSLDDYTRQRKGGER